MHPPSPTMTRTARVAGIGLVIGALLAGLAASPAAAYHRTETDGAVVTVSVPGGMTPEVAAAVVEAAGAAGGSVFTVHRGTIRLRAVTRAGTAIQEAPAGFWYPMAAAALDPDAAEPVIGREVAAALRSGTVVMGATSAQLRGALPGDTIEFVGWDGTTRTMTIGAVVADEAVDFAELMFRDADAAAFGFDRPSYLVVWGLPVLDSFGIELSLALPPGRVSVHASTDPPDPDSVLPTVLLKAELGEFAYRPTGDGDRVIIDPAWRAENIVDVRLPLLGPFRCHRRIVPALEAIVDEIIESGLAGLIDRQDFQIAGGCYNPRLIRGGDKGGAISRHTWGVAIDINPSENPYGGAVRMDPRIVEIFRRWGFAWGGGWTYTDGGHFEWTHDPGVAP